MELQVQIQQCLALHTIFMYSMMIVFMFMILLTFEYNRGKQTLQMVLQSLVQLMDQI